MPRFAVIVGLLLAAVMAAGAAAAWHGGWWPSLKNFDAAGTSRETDPARARDAVEHIAAAISDHDLAAVERYLAAGGDPNAADAEGEFLLNRAVLHGSPEIMEALLAAGADPDRPGRNGLSPLTIAALAGRPVMLERLMQANAAAPATRMGGPAPSRAAEAEKAGRAGTGGDTTAAPGAGSSERAGVLPSDGSGTAGPVLASLAGDGEPQPLLSAEPHVSMAGLVINPIARPLPGSPTPASTAGGGAEAQAALATAGAAAASSVAGPPAPWVTAAQKRLGQLGYYKGPVTGFAGSLTADAVKRYQAVAGLPQDGVVSADLLRRIGAVVEAPAAPAPAAPVSVAPAPVAPAPATPAPAAAATVSAGAAESGGAQGQTQGLQQVRNALGQEFNSATRPDALRQHCQANTNAWVYDEAIGRSLFCRDVLGAPPR